MTLYPVACKECERGRGQAFQASWAGTPEWGMWRTVVSWWTPLAWVRRSAGPGDHWGPLGTEQSGQSWVFGGKAGVLLWGERV